MVRDGEEVLIQSMNLSQEDLFEIGLAQKSNSVAAATLADFQEMKEKSSFRFSNVDNKALDYKVERPLPGKTIINGPTKVTLVRKRESIFPMLRRKNNAQASVLRGLLRNAQNTINIMTPNLNFKNYEETIMNAVRRGVQVRIILSNQFEEDNEKIWKFQGGTNTQVAGNAFESV